ncbi:MAG: hypothetical protein JWP45_2215 [Mucilaginibacter sp.]|jgi:hypothetical protein|nr:hypothetical protein [Mucilaginibacter sp.]MDB5139750.1 hypothetical protein [Mucilaginibacter sp.]
MEILKAPTIHLTGKEGEEFDLELSASWTKNYRHKHPGEPISHFFGKEILQKILAQDDCQGIRIYHAHSKPLNGWRRSMVSLGSFITKVTGNVDGEKHVIIVGASSDGKDQLNKPLGEPLSKNDLKDIVAPKKYMVAQQSSPCPGSPGCPLNDLTGG